MSAWGPGVIGWSVMSDLQCDVGAGLSYGADAHERLDRAPLVHRPVGLGDVVEVGLEVKDETWVDPPREDVVEEVGNVGTDRRRAALDPNVAVEHAGHRQLDIVRYPDIAHGRARSGDGHGRRDRIVRADALERRIDADPAGHLADDLNCVVPALRHDVRRAERAGEGLAGR